jgi:tRNA(Leu) C34 or U34 (ribose-2'-O)-methylase TrmL
VPFKQDDLLVLGSQTVRLPTELLDAHPKARIYIPIRPGVGSLKLAKLACLALSGPPTSSAPKNGAIRTISGPSMR